MSNRTTFREAVRAGRLPDEILEGSRLSLVEETKYGSDVTMLQRLGLTDPDAPEGVFGKKLRGLYSIFGSWGKRRAADSYIKRNIIPMLEELRKAANAFEQQIRTWSKDHVEGTVQGNLVAEYIFAYLKKANFKRGVQSLELFKTKYLPGAGDVEAYSKYPLLNRLDRYSNILIGIQTKMFDIANEYDDENDDVPIGPLAKLSQHLTRSSQGLASIFKHIEADL